MTIFEILILLVLVLIWLSIRRANNNLIAMYKAYMAFWDSDEQS